MSTPSTTGRWLVLLLATLVMGGVATGPWDEPIHVVVFHTPLPRGLSRLAESIEAERRVEPGAFLVGAGDWLRPEPWRVVERDGLRVAFVGLAAAGLDASLAAWDRASSALDGHADLLVPLAHLPLEEVRVLARARPGIQLIISSGDDTVRPGRSVREGTTLIVRSAAGGVSLGRIDLWLGRDTKRVVRSEANSIVLVGGPGPPPSARDPFGSR